MMAQNIHCTAIGIFAVAFSSLSYERRTLESSNLSPCKISSQQLLIPLLSAQFAVLAQIQNCQDPGLILKLQLLKQWQNI